MEKRINPPDDPRRLWKIQLAVSTADGGVDLRRERYRAGGRGRRESPAALR